LRGNGILADVAPTVLQVMGIAQPKDMQGRSLLLPLMNALYSFLSI
jgi:2,3-bisphosphoglycerate-independent phosphoglycerate mutase